MHPPINIEYIERICCFSRRRAFRTSVIANGGLTPRGVAPRKAASREKLFSGNTALTGFFFFTSATLIYGRIIAGRRRVPAHPVGITRRARARAFALVARGSDSARLKYRARLYGGVKITADRVIVLNCASPDKFRAGYPA